MSFEFSVRVFFFTSSFSRRRKRESLSLSIYLSIFSLTFFFRLPYLNNRTTVNGTSKTTSVRNMDADEVAAAAALLRGSAGRKSSVRAPARRHVPAEATRKGVQGGWRPGLAEEIMKARREA